MAQKPSDHDRPREIPFTVDGERYTTTDREQPAADILQLAGLDPELFDLGELRGGQKPKTKHYVDEALVRIRRHARFVSIRECAM